MKTVKWSQLGMPTEEGDVPVPDIGTVGVHPEDIERAEAWGDDPEFELIEFNFATSPRQYTLGKIVE